MLTAREVYDTIQRMNKIEGSLSTISGKIQEFEGVRYYLIPSGYYRANSRLGGARIHRVVWEHYNGPIPEGYVVHHIDGDKTNNDISNLAIMDDGQHKRLHQGTPEAIERKRFYASRMVEWNRSDEGRRRSSERAKQTRRRDPIKTYICRECGEAFQAKAPAGAFFCSPKCRMRDMRRRKREVAA